MKISTIKSIWWHLTLVPVIALGILLILLLASFVRDQWPKPEVPAQTVERPTGYYGEELIRYCGRFYPETLGSDFGNCLGISLTCTDNQSGYDLDVIRNEDIGYTLEELNRIFKLAYEAGDMETADMANADLNVLEARAREKASNRITIQDNRGK